MVAYTTFAVFIFSALALVLRSGFSYGAALLFLGAGVLLVRRPALRLTRADRILAGVFAAYFLINAALNGVHHAQLREYDAPARLLLAVPVLLVLCAWPARAQAWWGGVALGAVGAGIFAVFMHPDTRELDFGGITNPIQYGNISMLLGLLSLAGAGWAMRQPRRGWWLAAVLLGSAGGVLGAVLSGSRGSWLALPVCMCIVAVHVSLTHGRRYLIGGVAAMVLLVGGLYALPHSEVRERSDMAEQEVQAYFNENRGDTSVGQRLEMWRAGLTMIPGNLLTGVGKQGYMTRKQALIDAHQANPAIAGHTHLHNEYLDALVKRGLPGLAALMAVLLAPLWLFGRHLRDGPAVQPYALAGVVLCASYMVFGLTQAFFTHNNGVTMYAFWTAMLWTLLRSQLPTTTWAP